MTQDELDQDRASRHARSADGGGILGCDCSHCGPINARSDERARRSQTKPRTEYAGCDVCRIWEMPHPSGCGRHDPVTLY